MGYISRAELRKLAEAMGDNDYRGYLRQLLDADIFPWQTPTDE
jgi:hypothetical protein